MKSGRTFGQFQVRTSPSYHFGYSSEGAFDLVEFFYLDGSSGNSSVQGFTDNWTFFDVTSHLDAGKSLSGIGVYGSGAGAYLDDF